MATPQPAYASEFLVCGCLQHMQVNKYLYGAMLASGHLQHIPSACNKKLCDIVITPRMVHAMCQPKFHPIAFAIDEDLPQLAAALLSDEDARKMLDSAPMHNAGYSALRIAVSMHKPEIVQLILDYLPAGDPMVSEMRDGESVFYTAIAQELWPADDDDEGRSKNADTVLCIVDMLAKACGPELTRTLLRRGKNPAAWVLEYWCSYGPRRRDIRRRLIALGARKEKTSALPAAMRVKRTQAASRRGSAVSSSSVAPEACVQ